MTDYLYNASFKLPLTLLRDERELSFCKAGNLEVILIYFLISYYNFKYFNKSILFQNIQINEFNSISICNSTNAYYQFQFIKSLIKSLIESFTTLSQNINQNTFQPKTKWDNNRMHFLDDFVVYTRRVIK